MDSAGLILSDLHLFSNRSGFAAHRAELHHALRNGELVVLNGDIFDFRWTVLPTVEETAHAAARWLEEVCAVNRHCTVHYVLGNHDFADPFLELLPELQRRVDNLRIHSWFLRLGPNFITHGDAGFHPTGQALLAYRNKHRAAARKPPILQTAYKHITRAGIPNAVAKSLPVRRSLANLKQYIHNVDGGIRHITDVYFGHTHAPFADLELDGLRFHNTGTTVLGGRPMFHELYLPDD